MRLLEVHANHRDGQPTILLQRAEQDLLLVRLAADSGARRGELAALQLTDLDGRMLHIERAMSAGVITTPKAGRGRRITLGAHTADLWRQLVETWTHRWCDEVARSGSGELGPWLFAADLVHRRRLGAEVLGHRFARVRDEAGVSGATLHRFRHSVATTLVREGRLLDAQSRLGHADAATALREYAYVIPGTDTDVADLIDAHLDQCRFTDDRT
jgi:integrase